MRQIAKVFEKNTLGDIDVDTQCNRFLQEHPNYLVHSASYQLGHGCQRLLFVVFDIKEEKE